MAAKSLIDFDGPLADHYHEKLLRAAQLKNFALQDFVNIFNNRYMDLYSNARQKSKLYMLYGNNKQINVLKLILTAISRKDSYHFYAGLLSQSPCNSLSLKIILSDYFNLPITIKEFIGEWICLNPNDCTQLSSTSDTSNFNNLGINTFIGKYFWNIQNKFQIIIGPLKYDMFRKLLPDGAVLQALKKMIRYYVSDYYDFEIELTLKPNEIPYCFLRILNGMRLGWNTWLKSKPCSIESTVAVYPS